LLLNVHFILQFQTVAVKKHTKFITSHTLIELQFA